MSNAMIPLDVNQLPSTEVNEKYDNLAKGVDFLGRLQLYTRGKPIDKGLIAPGHYGIPVQQDEIHDLGDSCDVIPLARRPKAVDLSDRENIITVYDDESQEFKRIAEASFQRDSGCMFGVSFLMYERTTGRFLEFFCGTKSSRPEAKNIYPFLPHVEDGEQVGPFPMTLKVRYIEKKFSWHVPTVHKCSTPFTNLPDPSKVAEEIERFVNPKESEVEVVEDDNRRAR
jgi:hypothetical protein